MSLFKISKTDFEAVYDKYADMLYRLAFSHMQSREDAEDVVQEVFEKYLASSEKRMGESHTQAWLIRVTVNACYDALRKKRYRIHTPLDEIEETVSKEDEPLFGIAQIIEGLPVKYKTVIVLHYLEGYSVEELAHILKVSKSAVKMRLSRGRELLKDRMEKEERHV